jgi:DNA-binding transcriptional regulator YbjK
MRDRRKEKGERNRVALLEATIRLLARGGPRAVTHRAVAAEAGLSVRATTYHFGSRDALFGEALRHYATTAISRFDALAVDPEQLAVLGDGAIDVAAQLLAHVVVSDVVEDRDGLVAEFELVLEIARRPELEAVYREWQAKLEAMICAYAEHLGSSDPALDARVVLATLRGLEIEALARPSHAPDVGDLTSVFRRVLQGWPRRVE